jgi:hypothetical protein
VGRMEQATNRLEQAVARLEGAVEAVSGKAASQRQVAANRPPADVGARIDAVIDRLDRVLEG